MAYLLGIVYGGNRVCEGYYKPNKKKVPCHYLNKPNELWLENRSYSENRLG